MHERILTKLRNLVRLRRYVMTLHAEEEMSDDNLTIFDVEHGILTGKVIERQKDRETAEWKYLVKGQALSGEYIVVVVKVGRSGKLVFVTVYAV